MKIFLADLVYDTVKTNYVVPLNAGYLAAGIRQQMGHSTNIKIFKYPRLLEAAMRESPPSVLGLSYYGWNANLALHFARYAKMLNPDVITVFGGPNIRPDNISLHHFLTQHPEVDYYIVNEGEEPFIALIMAILNGERSPVITGAACLCNTKLLYTQVDINKKCGEITSASPYLDGTLDEFLLQQEMIPLLETNRGCPFGCVYCTWGSSALSRVRRRPLSTVLAEMEYVAQKSSGQISWIFCDANFGIMPRDVAIAEKMKEIMDTYGNPLSVTVWSSKNTSERNIKIAEILSKDNGGYIAIQSADPIVLKHSGRGSISFQAIETQIDHFHATKQSVHTDLLIGLPQETAHSHLQSIAATFDMGFDQISPYNIRMLPGSLYETKDYREKYGVETKFRPIFGSYGVYAGTQVLEMEESVRATSTMTERELNAFKVHHWLLYFAWNSGIFRPLLEFGRRHRINPGMVIDCVAKTTSSTLRSLFDDLLNDSMQEWFPTETAFYEYYAQPSHFGKLATDFVKLNMKGSSQILMEKKFHITAPLDCHIEFPTVKEDPCSIAFETSKPSGSRL